MCGLSFVADTDGFVIPSLGIGESDQSKPNDRDIESPNSAAQVGQLKEFFRFGRLDNALAFDVELVFTVYLG